MKTTFKTLTAILIAAALPFAFITPAHAEEGDLPDEPGIFQAQTATATTIPPVAVPASVVSLIKTSHPYILGGAQQFTDINTNAAKDSVVAKVKAKVIAAADKALGQPVQEFGLADGKRIGTVGSVVQDRAFQLGMAYQLTKDTKYSDRLYKELEHVAEYKNWNHAHFLDTASLATSMGIGYDWIYDTLNPAQKAKLSDAIITKAFVPAHTFYDQNKSWTAYTTNWNNVSNSGLTIAALAIAKERPVEAEAILQRSIPNSSKGLRAWAPSGSYNEGPSYASYAMKYTALMMSALTSSTGSDFNMSKQAGLSQAAYFNIYMQGTAPKTAFGYGEGIETINPAPENLYLANLYNDPVIAQKGYLSLAGTNRPEALIWYNSALPRKVENEAKLALDRYFSKSEVVSMRSGWGSTTQKNDTFVAFKGAAGERGHQDLDMGDFVLSSLGESFAGENGRDNYNAPGYFASGSRDRFLFYKKRAEGQNTIVFNPAAKTTKEDQNVNGRSKLDKFQGTYGKAFAILDLTDASPNDLVSWKRGITLFDNRSQVIVQDEVKGKPGMNDSWWFMNTGADIAIQADGKTAILTKGKAKMMARINSTDPNVKFSNMDSAALPTSPEVGFEQMKSKFRNLAIHIEGANEYTLAVQFTPLTNAAVPALQPIQPLAQWSKGKDRYERIQDIKVNGVRLDSFNRDVLTYNITTPQKTVPVITAKKRLVRDVVTITQPAGTTGTATVTVVNPDKGVVPLTYTINFLDNKKLSPEPVEPGFKALSKMSSDSGSVSTASVSSTLKSGSFGNATPTVERGKVATPANVSFQDVAGATVPNSELDIRYYSGNSGVATVNASNAQVKGEGKGVTTVYAIAEHKVNHSLAFASFKVEVLDSNNWSLQPAADAWVNGGGNADKVMGKGLLLVKDPRYKDQTNTVYDRKAFMSFNLPDLNGKQIVSAKLKFQANTADTAGESLDLTVRSATGTLDENAITFNNNKIVLGKEIGSVYVDAVRAERVVDLTTYLNGETKDARTLLLGFSEEKAKLALHLSILSKESGTPPVLEIVTK